MKIIKKSQKSCEACGGKNTKICLATYPLKVGEKQLNIGRVSVRKCIDCGVIKPTSTGQEKIGRCMMTFMSLLGDK